MSAKFLILKNILAELKRKNSITVLEEYYQDKWEFYDLLMDLTNDENFKQAYIDNSFSKSFKKDFDHYTELANQAKKTVSKYFRNKDIDLRAFYAKTNNSDRVLNINLINYNRSEPIRISDILQQERDISTLNIYCDKKHDIYAYRKGKERHYEFKEGAYYEMTSTWSVQDKDGKTVTCTMVMNVSNSGITKVLQFNGKDFKSPPEEFWNLIRQNEELYIQGLSLHDAVKALLGKNKDAPAVINLQNNEHIVINKDEKMKDLENDPKSNPILSFTSNNVSEVNPQQIATQAIATQTEVNSQHTETQTEVSVQHVKTQTEIGSQETETQTKVNLQEAAIQTEIAVQHIETQTEIIPQQSEAQNLQEVATQIEVSLQHIETQAEVTVQHAETQTGIGSQKTETQTEVNLQEAAVQTEVNSQQLDQKLTKAEQEIRELNELRNNLQYRLDKAEQEFEELEKHNSDLQNELGKEKQEIRELNEQRNDLQYRLDEAEQEIRELNQQRNNLQCRLEDAEQKFEKHNSDLQNKLEEEKQKNVKLQIGLTQKDEKLENISTELQEKIQELESAHEGKKDLEKKLTIANAKNEKLEDKLKQFKKEEEEAGDILDENWKDIQDLKSTIRCLDYKYNTNLESYKQEVDQLKQEYEELKNEVELKDEQIKKYKQQLSQKREETKENQLLKSKIKELEECNEHLTEIIGNKALEIERITRERKELNGTVQYLNSQVELLSPVIDQVLVNKKEVFDNNSKMFYQLTEKIDDSEKKSRSLSLDSAFHSDHCNSLLNLISSPSKVCSQSQRGNV